MLGFGRDVGLGLTIGLCGCVVKGCVGKTGLVDL